MVLPVLVGPACFSFRSEEDEMAGSLLLVACDDGQEVVVPHLSSLVAFASHPRLAALFECCAINMQKYGGNDTSRLILIGTYVLLIFVTVPTVMRTSIFFTPWPIRISRPITQTTTMRGFLLKFFHTPKPHAKTTRFSLAPKKGPGLRQNHTRAIFANPGKITRRVDDFHTPRTTRLHNNETQHRDTTPQTMADGHLNHRLTTNKTIRIVADVLCRLR
jgi:hypothetical protein